MAVNSIVASKSAILRMNRKVDLVFIKCPPVFNLCIFLNNLQFEICKAAK